jgi:hypothetical protein
VEKGEEADIQCSATQETHKFGEQFMSKYVCAAVREIYVQVRLRSG